MRKQYTVNTTMASLSLFLDTDSDSYKYLTVDGFEKQAACLRPSNRLTARKYRYRLASLLNNVANAAYL